ncbi:sulfotransferase family 2 domain-containing protein [Limnothrix sp. FACHB-881]|uniref:sulfotransferase family 2 domain-containing protein n=1 Tax=Limnothrix sp. FACHB-881 TaxID=2692819 RepID=UPI001684AA72|nr:sulfotransferase family 2 domain-containing protein [Limnothrix sp. FACHB-881]MBD2637086.1 sulfotransferase family 2 domain-containing protein [Limnothrix sp. FACHB-881]
MKNIPILIHSHIPKCAGTTINSQLVNFFGKENCLNANYTHNFSQAFNQLLRMDSDQLKKIRFIYGHLPVKWIESYLKSKIDAECYTFSILRDPLDRAMSQIFYWLEHGVVSISSSGQQLINRELVWRTLDENIEDFYIKWLSNYFFGGDNITLNRILVDDQETETFIQEVKYWFPNNQCLNFIQDCFIELKRHPDFPDLHQSLTKKDLKSLSEIYRLKAFLNILKGSCAYPWSEFYERQKNSQFSTIHLYSLSQTQALQSDIRRIYGFLIDFKQQKNVSLTREEDKIVGSPIYIIEKMLCQGIGLEQLKLAGAYPLTYLNKSAQILFKKVFEEFGGGLLHKKIALDSALYQYVTERSVAQNEGVAFWL